MPVAADDEDPLPSTYIREEVTVEEDYLGKCTAKSVKEANKQITITDLLKPILKNADELSLSSDMEHVVTTDMVHDTETLKNELAEDKPPLHLRTKPWRQSIHLLQVRKQ